MSAATMTRDMIACTASPTLSRRGRNSQTTPATKGMQRGRYCATAAMRLSMMMKPYWRGWMGWWQTPQDAWNVRDIDGVRGGPRLRPGWPRGVRLGRWEGTG